jgi:hypothetical protein
MRRTHAAAHHVGEILAGTPFGHDARNDIVTRCRDAGRLYLRIALVKLLQESMAAAGGVHHFAFLFSGLDDFLPFAWRSRFAGESATDKIDLNQKDEQQ